MYEKDGHFWGYCDKDHMVQGDRCTHCGRRIEHYLWAVAQFVPGESSFEQEVDLLCDHIIDKCPVNSEGIEPVGWGTYNRVQPTMRVIERSCGMWVARLYPQQYLQPSRKKKLQEISSPPGYYTGGSFEAKNFHPEWSADIE